MRLTSLLSLVFLAFVFVGCDSGGDEGITILSVTPDNGNGGVSVTITGENFGDATAGLSVRFGPTSATVTSVSETQIVTTVPDGAPIGATTIQVSRGDDTDAIDFTVNDPLVGNWVSEGTNIAPLLAAPPFNTVRITADFRADGTYTVVTTDASNSEVTLTGTWQATAGEGTIRNVTVSQSAPTTLTSAGIYQNLDGVLTYEVAQTNPPLTGVTPPTAAAGFGSTSGGNFMQLNVQRYVRATAQ
ncbi:MAG: IPT/TIG domain-containing protein [Bacteroidota bacterium]